MYTFLRDGEFVQIDVEEQNRVTGFISRLGSSESDRGAFLDHLFKEGSLRDDKLKFTTREVHGVRYEFEGRVERGSGKQAGSEGYFQLRGRLTEHTRDAEKKVTSRSRQVEFRSFPVDPMDRRLPATKD